MCRKMHLQEEFGFLLLILALVEQSLQSFVTQKKKKRYELKISNILFQYQIYGLCVTLGLACLILNRYV